LRPFAAVTAAVVSLPRSRNREAWQGLFGAWGFADPTTHSVMDSVGAALEYWHARLRAEDAVLVTGSCFMVAEVLHRLGFADLEATQRPQRGGGRGRR
jgi:folylpolyglutamate synthase/dihydropteroate synthase